ncbi:glycosyltransferase family 2 protein [Taibaiella koreensis]|uniref:glycosyltransferase family 2 protein n=1 Tax=Taibaiella koreensis TaxID=1268548 RepID=UPI0019690335|nr:glycosyltransferase [Taibaiella koreensis]
MIDTKEQAYCPMPALSQVSFPGLPKIQVNKRERSNAAATVAPRASSRINFLILAGTFLLMFAAVFLVYKLQPLFAKVQLERLSTPWGKAFIVVSLSLLGLRIAFLLYLFLLSLRYRSVSSVANELLPTCTVIVPAYNEGELVFQTLMSLANSDYPEGKMQIIAIDDGSGDDTRAWMKKAKGILGDRLSIYQQLENKGKRQALHRGFMLATGEVLVTVDSDSIVEENTLRNMVSPFVTNAKCGAVAGNVRVLNNKKGIIPKMLNVSFAFSFEFIRSAQSVLGSVFCTPGALAAYRKDVVLACLPQWINQTFMGKPSDIGEDRAMTNMILKQGYHVLFQRNAYVLTNIPEKYKTLTKMLIRWERSNVRESIMMSKFAFGQFREGNKAGTRVLLLDQWSKLILSCPMVLLMLFFILTQPLLFFSASLSGILVFSSIPMLFYARRYHVGESLWAYTYSIFCTFSLFWITPYSIATVARSGWLTRSLPGKK